MDISAIIIAASIPSALTGFCFWIIQHGIVKREEKDKEERLARQREEDRREADREQNEILLVKTVGAAIALGEATAKAVARIPDSHCNGDMHAALDYAAKVKHEQKEFLTARGIKSLYD